jgi:hypothetical protein
MHLQMSLDEAIAKHCFKLQFNAAHCKLHGFAPHCQRYHAKHEEAMLRIAKCKAMLRIGSKAKPS